MSLLVVVPGALRLHATDRPEIHVPFEGGSLAEALDALWNAAPGLRDRILTELNELRPHINVFVNGRNARDIGTMSARVDADAEIVLLPAVSGGEGTQL